MTKNNAIRFFLRITAAFLIIGLTCFYAGFEMTLVFHWMVKVAVLTAGFANAIALGHQAYSIKQSEMAEGHSIPMYCVFLYIQFSFAINGVEHDDWWAASGMFASMIPTLWIIYLIHKFRGPVP